VKVDFDSGIDKFISRENKISSLELSLQEKDTQLTNLNKQLAVARTSQTELAALKQRSTEEAAQLKDAEAKITTLETSVQTLKDKNNVSVTLTN